MKIGIAFTLKDCRDREGCLVHPGTGCLPVPGAGAADRADDWRDDEEEFDSPETIRAIADALQALGHEVEPIGDGETMLRRLLDGKRPDLVFNIAEGRGAGRCREARVPAILETLGIPYTGSDALTLAATLDKECAKRLVRSHGVPTPDWALVNGDPSVAGEALARLTYPLIVKPACEGSSKGITMSSVVETESELDRAVAFVRERYRQPALVEEYIEGDELTVGLIGNGDAPAVLGILGVRPRGRAERFVYGLEAKRNWREEIVYECPAELAPAVKGAIESAAVAAWRALGCRDVARVDFRLREGTPYFLEVNPLPGLSPESGDIVMIARAMGIGHRELIGRILAAALARS